MADWRITYNVTPGDPFTMPDMPEGLTFEAYKAAREAINAATHLIEAAAFGPNRTVPLTVILAGRTHDHFRPFDELGDAQFIAITVKSALGVDKDGNNFIPPTPLDSAAVEADTWTGDGEAPDTSERTESVVPVDA